MTSPASTTKQFLLTERVQNTDGSHRRKKGDRTEKIQSKVSKPIISSNSKKQYLAEGPNEVSFVQEEAEHESVFNPQSENIENYNSTPVLYSSKKVVDEMAPFP